MYKDLGIVLGSTGGYASNINGAAEAPHRTIKRFTQANLFKALLANYFWYFVCQYSALTYTQCINHTTGKLTGLVYCKKLIKSSKLHTFGSRVKTMKELKTQRALSAWISSNMRDDIENEISMEEIDQHSSFDGRFF